MTYSNGFSRGVSKTLFYDRVKVLQHRAKLRSPRLPGFESTLILNCPDALGADRRPRDVSPIPVPQSVPKADLDNFLREMQNSDNGQNDPAPVPTPVPTQKEASIKELMLCDLLSALPLAEALKPVTREDLVPVHALLMSIMEPNSLERYLALDLYWHLPPVFEQRFNDISRVGMLRLYTFAIKFSRIRQNGDGEAPPGESCENEYECNFEQAMKCALSKREMDLDLVPAAFVRENESDYERTERWRKNLLEHVVPEKYRELVGRLSVADMVRLCECLREHLEPWEECEAAAGAGEHGEQDGHDCHGDAEEQCQHKEEIELDRHSAETDEHKKRQKKAKKARQKQNRKEREQAAELAAAEHAAPAKFDDTNSTAVVTSEDEAVTPERPELVDASTQTDVDAGETIEAALALLNIASLSEKLGREAATDSPVPPEDREVQPDFPDVPITLERPEISERPVPESPESHTLGALTPPELNISEPDLEFAQTKPMTPGFLPPATLCESTPRFQGAGTPEPQEFAQTRPPAPSPCRSVTADQTPVRLPCFTAVTGCPEVPRPAESQTSEHAPLRDSNISEQSPGAKEVLSRDSSPALSITSDVDRFLLPIPFEKEALPQRAWSEPDRLSRL